MIRQALLALLRLQAKYGYQLKSEFEAATGTAWALNIGQVYTTLARMERDGAIRGSGADDEGRERYEITADGIRELDAWLGQAVERSTATRDELVMKVLLALATGVADPVHIIQAQRAASLGLLQQATMARNAAGSLADRLHLERLVALTTAELRWLDLADELVNSRPEPARPDLAARPDPDGGPPPTHQPREDIDRAET